MSLEKKTAGATKIQALINWPELPEETDDPAKAREELNDWYYDLKAVLSEKFDEQAQRITALETRLPP